MVAELSRVERDALLSPAWQFPGLDLLGLQVRLLGGGLGEIVVNTGVAVGRHEQSDGWLVWPELPGHHRVTARAMLRMSRGIVLDFGLNAVRDRMARWLALQTGGAAAVGAPWFEHVSGGAVWTLQSCAHTTWFGAHAERGGRARHVPRLAMLKLDDHRELSDGSGVPRDRVLWRDALALQACCIAVGRELQSSGSAIEQWSSR